MPVKSYKLRKTKGYSSLDTEEVVGPNPIVESGHGPVHNCFGRASLAEFRKLPQHVQTRAVLKALADRFPRGTINRVDLLLEPYNTTDPEGFALGLPEDERHDAVRYLYGSPWRFLINDGFIAVTKNDFYEITPEGLVEAADDIMAVRVDRTIVEALRFLHPYLQGYSRPALTC
jgi:hypothetical protein